MLPDDPKPWTVKTSRYLFREPPWWMLREDHVVLPNGAEIERYWVSEYPAWCNVVAVTTDERIVLVRQYRHGVQAVHYEIPGGVADHGTPLESAQQELLEETGYAGGDWEPLLTVCANPGLQTNLTHVFLARGVRFEREPTHEDTEDMRVHVVTTDEARAIVDRGEMIQAMHLAALLRYLLTR